MPSSKPVIAIRTKQENIDKFKIVADNENRSMGNLAELLIVQYIKKYEEENGEIMIGRGGWKCLIIRPAAPWNCLCLE